MFFSQTVCFNTCIEPCSDEEHVAISISNHGNWKFIYKINLFNILKEKLFFRRIFKLKSHILPILSTKIYQIAIQIKN